MKKLLLLLLTTFTVNIFAQDYDEYLDTLQLDEIKVVSTLRIKAPISSKLMNKFDIELKNVGQEPSYILNTTPSVTNYSDNGSCLGYSYFRLRGIDQTRINMTFDGIPLNETEDQGAYFSNYPDFFSNINSLQIQRGVGTTSNGVSSYAGSINFESPLLTDNYLSEFNANYGSFNTYRFNYKYNSSIVNNKALYIGISKLHTDGYKYHSGNDSKSAFFSTGYFKDNNILKLTGFIGNQQNDLAWLGVSDIDIKKDRKNNGCSDTEKDNFTQGLIKLLFIHTFNSNSYINSTLYYNTLSGHYGFDLNNFLKIPLDSTLYDYHFNHDFVGFNTNYSYILDNFKFYTGINLNTINRQHIGSEKWLGELYINNGIKKEFDYFNKIVYTFNKVSVYGDIQYRYTDFNYNGDVALKTIKWNFINWRYGIDYDLNENINLYYGIGKSYREPTRNDLFLGNDNLLIDSLNNPIIGSTTPEQVLDNELGVKFNYDNCHIYFNGYFMDFKNEIVLNGQIGPNGILLHSNVANSYRTGLELDVEYLTGEFTFTNNSNYSFNAIEQNNEEITPILTPKLIINQDIMWEHNRWSLILSAKYQDWSYLDFANKFKIDAFYTFNIFCIR